MFTMTRIVLAVMAVLLLVAPFSWADSPGCRMNDLAQTASLGRIDPCPESDQSAISHTIHVHICNCGSLIGSAPTLVTAVLLPSFTFFMDALWPQTAVTAPHTPPPRTI